MIRLIFWPLGLSREGLAKRLGVDESTVETIEKSWMVLRPKVTALMRGLLADSPTAEAAPAQGW